MTKRQDFLRTPQKQVGGLGSAKHGVEHWMQQRVTAIALVFLSIYIAYMFFANVVFGDYESANRLMSHPDVATITILFLAVAFQHAILGLQVVIEDYVHTEGLKIASILGVKFASYSFALIGILSVVKILLWGAMMPVIQNILTTP